MRTKLAVSLVALAGCSLVGNVQAVAETAMPEPPLSAEDCRPDELLVNPCRPWLGATAWGYPDAPRTVRAQIEAHERRIAQRLDIVHQYTGVGDLPLGKEVERYFATRPDTILFQNWKPAARWADAGGNDEAVNAHIDRAADTIKSIAPRRIILTLHHEPENDVTEGSAGKCTTKPGARAGTPEEYVRMWHNVRERFEARGATNVVWAVTYMNYSEWDCLVPLLYPGDEYVDWIAFGAYRGKKITEFEDVVTRFEKVMSTVGNAMDKPWAIAEWGVSQAPQSAVYDYYDAAREAVADRRFPRIKAYVVFDHPGPKQNGGLRVAYSDDGDYDWRELREYRAFARTVKLSRTGWWPDVFRWF